VTLTPIAAVFKDVQTLASCYIITDTQQLGA
jgi:hypothetical protein